MLRVDPRTLCIPHAQYHWATTLVISHKFSWNLNIQFLCTFLFLSPPFFFRRKCGDSQIWLPTGNTHFNYMLAIPWYLSQKFKCIDKYHSNVLTFGTWGFIGMLLPLVHTYWNVKIGQEGEFLRMSKDQGLGVDHLGLLNMDTPHVSLAMSIFQRILLFLWQILHPLFKHGDRHPSESCID